VSIIQDQKKPILVLASVTEHLAKIPIELLPTDEFIILISKNEEDLYHIIDTHPEIEGILYYTLNIILENFQKICTTLREKRLLPIFLLFNDSNDKFIENIPFVEICEIIYLNTPKPLIRKMIDLGIKNFQKYLENLNQIEKSTAILNSLPDLIFIINRNGEIIDYNANQKELLYVQPDFFLGKNISGVLPPDVAELTKKHIIECLSNGRTTIYEYSLDYNNQKKYFEARISVYGKDKILAIVRDISERIQLENELKLKDERYRLSLYANNDGIWDWDLPNDKVIWDARSYEMLGFKPDEFPINFAKWFSLLHEDDRERAKNSLGEQISKGETFSIEFRYRTKDNKYIWVDGRGKVIEWQDDKPKRIIGTHTDKTGRKLTELALAEEKELLRVTLRSIGDGVITTDIEGKIQIINNVAEELTGWTQKEAENKPLMEIFNIINETTRKPIKNPVEKVILSGEIVELANHTLLISKNRKERVIADSGAPIKDKMGKIIGVVLVFRDITQKQKLLEASERNQKLESLGILAGGIAHDFNNLLAGIYGCVGLAQSITTEPEVREYLITTMESMDRAKSLTQQLLTFSKSGIPNKKTDSLIPVIQKTAKFALSGSNVTCKFDLPIDLYLCDYDHNQIGQLIENIVINAQQAMPTGGIVTISAENIHIKNDEKPPLSEGKYVHLAIKDIGIGIPKEMFKQIFDPFFTTKQKGSGLGLAISYSIVNRHEGLIDVESEQGVGTTFHIYLPASKSQKIEEENHKAKYFKGDGKILLMDDEEYILKMFDKMLKYFGFSVITCKNGEEALEHIKKANNGADFSAAILDLTIHGGMGGKETINEIRKINADLPVFVVSGYAEDPILGNPRKYGFTAGLKKPFSIEDLNTLFSTYLESGKAK
jgi:PAS domain S-box-containing protein